LVADGKLAAPPKDSEVLGLCALGITAGFVGFNIIKLLARRLSAEVESQLKDLRDSKAEKGETEILTRRLEEAEKKEGEALKMVELNAAIFDGWETANKHDEAAISEIEEALSRLQTLLRNDFPTNRSAGIIVGRLLRNHNRFPDAIDQLTAVLDERQRQGLSENADTAALLYNRACYRNILAETKASQEQENLKKLAEDDLLRDGKLVPEDLLAAEKDSDLRSLINRPKLHAAINMIKSTMKIASPVAAPRESNVGEKLDR